MAAPTSPMPGRRSSLERAARPSRQERSDGDGCPAIAPRRAPPASLHRSSPSVSDGADRRNVMLTRRNSLCRLQPLTAPHPECQLAPPCRIPGVDPAHRLGNTCTAMQTPAAATIPGRAMTTDRQPTFNSRRDVLQLAPAAGIGCAAALMGKPAPAQAQAPLPVRIVGNSGTENNTLQQLLKDQGYLEGLGLAPTLVGVKTPVGTLDALVADQGDICMISGFNGLLPAIEKGAPVRVLGAAHAAARARRLRQDRRHRQRRRSRRQAHRHRPAAGTLACHDGRPTREARDRSRRRSSSS